MNFPRFTVLIGLATGFATLAAAGPVIKIDASAVTAGVSPMLYGLMTEEINYSYDGGLYAELIRNRIFKDDAKDPVHWTVVQDQEGTSKISLDETQPVENTVLTTCLKLEAAPAAGSHRVGVANDGFWGIPVKPSTTYHASFYAKSSAAAGGPLTVSIESNDGGKIYASTVVPKTSNQWHKYTVSLTTNEFSTATPATRFVIATTKPGTFWFNLVSLFPPTYNKRPNGNRPDLMQLLVDMKPSFLRLPGGNYLEGDTVANRFDWKKTLGPLEQRPGHPGCWSYRSSDGMGLLEYMLWCEDMKAEPLLAVFAGYALKGECIPVGPELQPYVDEALEEIEYITGGPETKWGARRAKDGHPNPFKLTCVEIGNEDGFDKTKSYSARYAQFHDAIRAKYPDLKLISTVGGKDSVGKRQSLTGRTPDFVDEHYYLGAQEMMNNSARYDSYDRTGPKIFVGEWATREGAPTTNMIAALGDAAWMIGMERNADVVQMSCYAPLFVNVNPGGMQWKSDLIGYDVQNCYGSPSYYAQKMFKENLGDAALAISLEGVPPQTWQPRAPKGKPEPEPKQIPSLFACVTKSTKTGTLYLKVANTISTAQAVDIQLTSETALNPEGTAITLSSALPEDTNSIKEPKKIVPVTTKVPGVGAQFNYTFAPYSATVLVISNR